MTPEDAPLPFALRSNAGLGGRLMWRWNMRTKTIQWMGRQMLVACDGQCSKAWGISQRPKEQLGADDDDVAFLADSELGEAPADPGTYEGGRAKPAGPDGMNKWCARECERSDMASTVDLLRLPDFSERLFNQPWKHGKTPNAKLNGTQQHEQP